MATSKLTQEELQQLQQTQNSNQALVQELGQIALAQIDLDKRQENAETFLDNLRKSEADIAKALEDKYGRGSINLETGEIVTEDPIPTGNESVELPKLSKDEVEVETEEPAEDSTK